MEAPALVATGLTLGHGGAPAVLAGVSIAVRPGDFIAVIGTNGAGKSTLLNALTGALAPRAGSIGLAGRPLGAFDPAERARLLAVVPQSENTPEDFTALEIAEAGRFAHAEPRATALAKARAALAAVDLAGKADAPFATLSAGERQRVLLARALAQDAPFLFCDEPVTNLDPAHQWALYELLKREAEGGRAVVVLEHQVLLVKQFARRVIILSEGGIVHDGPAAELSPADLARAYCIDERVGAAYLGGVAR